jgi:urea transporter
MSFGQVMFQGNIITGIIFLLAIFINSRQSAIYAFYGAMLASFIAIIFSFPVSIINIGLFGYNAILCGIALESIQWKGFIFTTISIILSIVFFIIFQRFEAIALTAPFVLATWIVLIIKDKKSFFIKSRTL